MESLTVQITDNLHVIMICISFAYTFNIDLNLSLNVCSRTRRLTKACNGRLDLNIRFKCIRFEVACNIVILIPMYNSMIYVYKSCKRFTTLKAEYFLETINWRVLFSCFVL